MAKGVSFRKFIIVDDSTISETRDYQEEKRPRKRARVESIDSEDSDDEEPNTKDSNHSFANGWSSLTPSEKPGERDALYYLDDPTATCIFRVGDVLFKVSFFFLLLINVINDWYRSIRRYSSVLSS
jgi:hypothetical protein